MTRQEFKALNDAAVAGTIKDDENPAFILSTTSVELLSKIAKREINVIELAKRMLESRGLNEDGQWVGFNKTIGR